MLSPFPFSDLFLCSLVTLDLESYSLAKDWVFIFLFYGQRRDQARSRPGRIRGAGSLHRGWVLLRSLSLPPSPFMRRDNQASRLRPTLIRRLEGDWLSSCGILLPGYILPSIDQAEGYLNRLGSNQPPASPCGTLPLRSKESGSRTKVTRRSCLGLAGRDEPLA